MARLTPETLGTWVAETERRFLAEPECLVEILAEVEGDVEAIMASDPSPALFRFGLFMTSLYVKEREEAPADQVLRAMLAHLHTDHAKPFLSSLLSRRASLNRRNGNLGQAKADALHAIELAREQGNTLMLGDALYQLYKLLYQGQEFHEALTVLQDAQGMFEQAGAHIEMPNVLLSKAIIYRSLRDPHNALSTFKEAVEWAKRLEYWAEVVNAGTGVIELLVELGHFGEAEVELERTKRCQELSKGMVANNKGELASAEAQVLAAQGFVDRAVALLEDYVATIPEYRSYHLLRRLDQLVDLLLAAGRPREAMETLSRTEERRLRMAREAQNEHLTRETFRIRAENLENERKTIEHQTQELRTKQDELLTVLQEASISRLLAGLSHELNTPLGNASLALSSIRAAVDNNGERADRSVSLDRVRSGIHLAGQSLKKAGEIVRGFERLLAGNLVAGREWFALADLIEEVWDQVNGRSANLRLVTRGLDPGVQLFVSRTALVDVLVPLFENVRVHAYGDEGGDVHLQFDVNEHHGMLKVLDEGRGIPAEIGESLFDPYATTRFGKGRSGLGLYIAATTAREHLGGSLVVEANEPNGTAFLLSWPLDPKGVRQVP